MANRPLPIDPITEARRHWDLRWDGGAVMAAATSIMRGQQIVQAQVDEALRPYQLTFARYEALVLLSFTRTGALPMGKMGERLMVHPASVTNAIGRLQQRGLVERHPSPDDRRVVLAKITQDGRALADDATAALNQVAFGLPDLTRAKAAEVTGLLRTVRVSVGDVSDETAGG